MIQGANTTVSIYPISHGNATSTFAGSPSASGIEAYIESQRADFLQVVDQGKDVEVFVMHIEPLTLKMGDKVVDANSTEYRVAGIERHENNFDTDNLLVVILHKKHH